MMQSMIVSTTSRSFGLSLAIFSCIASVVKTSDSHSARMPSRITWGKRGYVMMSP